MFHQVKLGDLEFFSQIYNLMLQTIVIYYWREKTVSEIFSMTPTQNFMNDKCILCPWMLLIVLKDFWGFEVATNLYY